MKFQVIFTFDEEYNGYVAEVPRLPGCVSQGKTMDEAIANVKDAIQGYLYVQEKHQINELKEETISFIGEVVV
ncbi:toxin-antitoxin system antidote component [Cyanobacterium sp. HL-69]|uniref:type II toxin-antitoxin system HicB family antitoxin n=1 Tax=Cyanobacterium sp. HL-69 TaxID=2054282 RepID=UPI000CA21289|nr:toxin-antitoxin system antidote component [Cyanobacterium sp. HL-69]